MKKIGFLIIRILVVVLIISTFAPSLILRWLKYKREKEMIKWQELYEFCQSHPNTAECLQYEPNDDFTLYNAVESFPQ